MYVVTLGELAAPIVSQDRKHGCGASWGEMRRVESPAPMEPSLSCYVCKLLWTVALSFGEDTKIIKSNGNETKSPSLKA